MADQELSPLASRALAIISAEARSPGWMVFPNMFRGHPEVEAVATQVRDELARAGYLSRIVHLHDKNANDEYTREVELSPEDGVEAEEIARVGGEFPSPVTGEMVKLGPDAPDALSVWYCTTDKVKWTGKDPPDERALALRADMVSIRQKLLDGIPSDYVPNSTWPRSDRAMQSATVWQAAIDLLTKAFDL